MLYPPSCECCLLVEGAILADCCDAGGPSADLREPSLSEESFRATVRDGNVLGSIELFVRSGMCEYVSEVFFGSSIYYSTISLPNY